MKVQFTRTYYKKDYSLRSSGDLYSGPKKGDLKECTLVAMPPCCDAMKTAIDDFYIGFGEFIDGFLNKNENVNISVCSPYPEGACWDFMPIQKCPFCGEDIEVEAQ